MSTTDSQAQPPTSQAAPAAPQPVQQVQQQTQQQQQPQQSIPAQQPAPSTPQPAPAPASVAGDSLICQWSNCGERCASPEQLYDHVCERHVGRKSTNNLNLTCQWGNCRTTTVKRDHITSHIRVHVPLKPHKCDFCGKAFKRPQDLKKHVKTHADDSVLLRSPDPSRGGHSGSGGYQPNSGKLVADLQALAGAASGYYPDNNINPNGGYGQQHPGAPPPGYYTSAPQNSAYGPVYYAVNPPGGINADYELRKRAAIDALNEFFGDAKRHRIDPTQYYDVGQRLMGLQSIPLIVGAGGGGGGGYHGGDLHAYSAGGTMVASATHPGPGQHYSLPLPNLRTKSDLINIDQFLEQLQSTVYENSTQAAAAGVAQPGAHYLHSAVNYRSSNSPPGIHNSGAQPATSHATAITPLTTAPSSETPALTPASSVLSYASGQSPGSVHSTQTVSPVSRPSIGSMYPTLPSVSAISDMAGSYSTSSAPHSALAPSFDANDRRRYSAGLLQKAVPDRRPSDPMDTSDGATTPQQSPRSSAEREGLRHDVNKLALASPTANVDPSLRSPGEQSSSSGDHAAETAAQESWIENVRTIEKLRSYIKEKLEAGDFDDDITPTEPKPPSSPTSDEQSLYPVLRAVRGNAD